MQIKHLFFPALLGFVSGIPLMLTGGTLQAWGTSAGLSLMAIGALTLIGQPYAYKFLWSPLIDKYSLPFGRGHRRSWVLAMMLLLMISLFFLSLSQPTHHLVWFISCAVIVAICAATLDLAIDAFRIEFLPKEDYGVANASYVSAYRISMLISGGLALIIADRYGWRITYQLMIGLILISFFIFMFAPEPQHKTSSNQKTNWRQSIITPFKDLLQRKDIGLMLLFVVLYKFGEALGTALTTPFILKELHFSLTVLGGAYKTIGLLSVIVGGFLGGFLYKRYSLYATLLSFGFFQALGILSFAWLAHVGHNLPLMLVSMSAEAFTMGMTTTVFISLLMRICNPFYAATHFALLSACASLARIFTGPLASALVNHYHWQSFFIISFFSCLPGLILLIYLKPKLNHILFA